VSQALINPAPAATAAAMVNRTRQSDQNSPATVSTIPFLSFVVQERSTAFVIGYILRDCSCGLIPGTHLCPPASAHRLLRRRAGTCGVVPSFSSAFGAVSTGYHRSRRDTRVSRRVSALVTWPSVALSVCPDPRWTDPLCICCIGTRATCHMVAYVWHNSGSAAHFQL